MVPSSSCAGTTTDTRLSLDITPMLEAGTPLDNSVGACRRSMRGTRGTDRGGSVGVPVTKPGGDGTVAASRGDHVASFTVQAGRTGPVRGLVAAVAPLGRSG